MKKYGLRVLVGLFAFAIGANAEFYLLQISPEAAAVPEIRLETTYSNAFVTVKFAGLKEVGNRFGGVKFEITNNSPMTMYYRSRQIEQHEINIVSLNGHEGVRIGYCEHVVRQMKEYSIEPNQSRTFEIDSFRFRNYSGTDKNQTAKVGFDLRFGEFNNYETFWSEDFELPKSVQNDLEIFKR
jgi:hypothetical protein